MRSINKKKKKKKKKKIFLKLKNFFFFFKFSLFWKIFLLTLLGFIKNLHLFIKKFSIFQEYSDCIYVVLYIDGAKFSCSLFPSGLQSKPETNLPIQKISPVGMAASISVPGHQSQPWRHSSVWDTSSHGHNNVCFHVQCYWNLVHCLWCSQQLYSYHCPHWINFNRDWICMGSHW